MHRLRLSDGRGQTIEFHSGAAGLSSHLNDAYLSYCRRYRHCAVILEIFHKIHGWQPVYDQDGYCRMIQNPLRVDYKGLKRDIFYTLTIVDSWPSQRQKRQMETRLQAQQRQEDAVRRRDTFKLVQGGI